VFGDLLKGMRNDSGMSLSDLAERIHYSRGYIGNVENGVKLPDRRFAELADRELDGHGNLVEAWLAADRIHGEQARTRRNLAAATRESELIAAELDAGDVSAEEIHADVERLAAAYLGMAPAPILVEARELRAGVVRQLRGRAVGHGQRVELLLAAGRLSGVLSYAALDLGDPAGAAGHTRAAFVCAERAGDNELRAWVRGTQSLIARFTGEYEQALDLVLDGRRYATSGSAEARILCGQAQCLANMGDSPGANAALNAAEDARERINVPDSVGGLFAFSRTKQHYYAGSSLIWLEGGDDARRAAREAALAIELWRTGPLEDRSLDDEALAHIYLGTAELQLRDLDAAASAVRPILELPTDRWTAWLGKRVARMADLLQDGPFGGYRPAQGRVRREGAVPLGHGPRGR
jgi:transcriptional regulator with XRE-family HTH domain